MSRIASAIVDGNLQVNSARMATFGEKVEDNFLEDIGVDFRGLGGTNGGPLAVLDDVTAHGGSGLG